MNNELETIEKTKEINKVTFIQLLKSIDRKGMNELISWLESTTFFDDPASARFHGNYPGGLCRHSLNVYSAYINKFAEDDTDTVKLACLLHDVCKIGTYRKVYNSNPNDISFKYENQSTFPYGHGEKSVYMLMKYIDLTEEEVLMIRWHMGAYEGEKVWKDLGEAQSKYKSVLYIHFADMIASKYLD